MSGPDWLRFPSLTALRAFEATARLGGFSAAARVLNVTHAAVAQQVRGLERELGRELVYRDGRAVLLTAEGQKLAQALGEGFRTIEAALAELGAEAEGQPLRLSLSPAFASQWLMPRLAAFWSVHPEIALTLHPDQRVVDLRREGIDLAIRVGAGRWPGLEAEFLIPARLVVVAAPALLAGRARLSKAEMSAMPWVIEQDWPEPDWLRGYGLDPDALHITQMPNEELALSAARLGYGLHVEAAALVEQDLRAGTLVAVDELTDDSWAYYLVTRPGPQRPELRQFIRWLKAQLAPERPQPIKSADRRATSRP